MDTTELLRTKEIIEYFDCRTRQVLIEKAPFKVQLKCRVRCKVGFYQKQILNDNTGRADYDSFMLEESELFVKKVNKTYWKKVFSDVGDNFGYRNFLGYRNSEEFETEENKYFVVVDYTLKNKVIQSWINKDYQSIGSWINEEHMEIILDENGNKKYC